MIGDRPVGFRKWSIAQLAPIILPLDLSLKFFLRETCPIFETRPSVAFRDLRFLFLRK